MKISDADKPLADREYLLEKFPGKGGWTYARIPEIIPDKRAHFGWVRVRGYIDDYAISGYHLMPMGDKTMFLPVKAEIRKITGKSAGDMVHIKLYADDLPTEIPSELRDCLLDEPGALQRFTKYSNAEQKAFIGWIYSAKTENTKVKRIGNLLTRLSSGLS
jgi:hypothetical protein